MRNERKVGEHIHKIHLQPARHEQFRHCILNQNMEDQKPGPLLTNIGRFPFDQDYKASSEDGSCQEAQIFLSMDLLGIALGH